jgi:hypothetical protein
VVLSGLAFLVFPLLWACHAGLNTGLKRRFMRGVFPFDLGHGTVRRAQLTVPRVVWGSAAIGRERPHETFWAAESRKSGVAPARFCSLHTAAFEGSASDVPFSQNLRRGQGEDLGADDVEV